MSVRCRNQHPAGGDAGFFARHLLGTIKQFPGHHAAINDHDRQLGRAIVQDQAPGEDRIAQLRRAALQKPSIHKNREGTGRNVDRACASAKSPPGLGPGVTG